MKVGVRVMPRSEVLDTQGRAVEKVLSNHGHKVSECRVGKYIVLDIAKNSEAEALQEAEKAAKFALHNPLIETFELEIIK